MRISLNEVAEILSRTGDEVMFLVQGGDLVAYINEDDMSWEFNLNHVLSLKRKLDEEVEDDFMESEES